MTCFSFLLRSRSPLPRRGGERRASEWVADVQEGEGGSKVFIKKVLHDEVREPQIRQLLAVFHLDNHSRRMKL